MAEDVAEWLNSLEAEDGYTVLDIQLTGVGESSVLAVVKLAPPEPPVLANQSLA